MAFTIWRHCASCPCGSVAPVTRCDCAIVSHFLESFRDDEFLKGRADFGYGGESGGVGAGEATEGDVDRLLLRLLWFAVFDQAGRNEAGGDGRIAGTVCEVFAVDGEVE